MYKNGVSNDGKNICPHCDTFKTRTAGVLERHIEGCQQSKTGQVFEVSGSELKFRKTVAQFPVGLTGTPGKRVQNNILIIIFL